MARNPYNQSRIVALTLDQINRQFDLVHVAIGQLAQQIDDLSTALARATRDTEVTPGSYTHTNITVDAKGRITAATNG